jgi:hypothetical protein
MLKGTSSPRVPHAPGRASAASEPEGQESAFVSGEARTVRSRQEKACRPLFHGGGPGYWHGRRPGMTRMPNIAPNNCVAGCPQLSPAEP